MRSHLLWAAVALLGACAVARCERDYDDKPYKFGFNIEKHHHRLEEKDTQGLIKGEFGFVTGDGVYHETAYATDEAGDFKILGMRSYFVGLPGLDLPDITKGSKPTPPKAAPVVPAAPASMPLQPLDLSGIMGCSGCTIPTGPSKPLNVGVTGNGGIGDPLGRPAAAFGGVAGGSDPFSRPPSAFGGPGGPSPTGHRFQQGGSGSGSGGSPQPPPYTPTTSSASNIKVGGFTAEDMKALLYRFNYTLGFHGHHEVGDRAGHKKGDYHFNGRDGFERAVQYTANELGYQPNITLRELGADSRATPRQDTEKGAEFGLKGFEFVWFNPQQNAGRAARALQGNRHINRPGGRLQR